MRHILSLLLNNIVYISYLQGVIKNEHESKN
jgi:hypothetical protein